MAPSRTKKASNATKTIEVKESGAKTAVPPDVETSPSTEPEQHPTNAAPKTTDNKQSGATKTNNLDSVLVDQQPQSIRPSVSPSSPKKRSPTRPMKSRVQQTDYTNVTEATKCHGGIFVLDIKKASGEPAFKMDIKDAIVKEKEGTDKLGIMAVVNHKMEPTLDSKPVCVGKKGVPDKVFPAYYEEGLDENEEIAAMLVMLAKEFEKYTKPFNKSSSKPKARAGKLTNPDDAVYADEILYAKDVAGIFTKLYPDAMTDGTFDDDEVTKDVLGNYFSLISIKEAKELVMDAFAKRG